MKKFIPVIAHTLTEGEKGDPSIEKKMSMEADVPEFLAAAGRKKEANELTKAVGDLPLIVFYSLLHIGEYTVKGTCTCNKSKQTVQFCQKDAMFFKKDTKGVLKQLLKNASEEVLLSVDAVILVLENQKNGWK